MASHLVINPALAPLEGVLDVRAILVPALGAAREAVLLAREEPQERAGERYPQPELPVRVCNTAKTRPIASRGKGNKCCQSYMGILKTCLVGCLRRYRRWFGSVGVGVRNVLHPCTAPCVLRV